MVPLYLPLAADKTEPLSHAPIFFGGINVYLQQKLALFPQDAAVDRQMV